MGVWIETCNKGAPAVEIYVTPCMGVWIETFYYCEILRSISKSHPVWVCGLKLDVSEESWSDDKSHPVWVCGLKLHPVSIFRDATLSHPVWVCGLKRLAYIAKHYIASHTLYGCVD